MNKEIIEWFQQYFTKHTSMRNLSISRNGAIHQMYQLFNYLQPPSCNPF